MKLMFASDIHGDIECAKKTVEAFEREGAVRLFLLGDILYFGPRNKLRPTYAPQSVIELLNSYKDRIVSVRGNCDAEIDQTLLEFPIMAEYSYVFADGLSMLLTHGHKINMDSAANLRDGDILIHGHTHVLCIKEFGRENIYLNPGSTTYPKEGNPPSYMTYEKGVFEIKHLESGEIIKKIDLRKE